MSPAVSVRAPTLPMEAAVAVETVPFVDAISDATRAHMVAPFGLMKELSAAAAAVTAVRACEAFFRERVADPLHRGRGRGRGVNLRHSCLRWAPGVWLLKSYR